MPVCCHLTSTVACPSTRIRTPSFRDTDAAPKEGASRGTQTSTSSSSSMAVMWRLCCCNCQVDETDRCESHVKATTNKIDGVTKGLRDSATAKVEPHDDAPPIDVDVLSLDDLIKNC
ncbi:uncharacterized protein [Zea mays]|uniref:Uncharacterized protein n=2 Tax=Zea mays TaxID=4577 RepID=A0A1D6JQM0_MAIZE|nr:uncharacterized protein LOC103631799 [Zea mays]ONL94278.1 hypothetical protein ZEAMMB73_Zm00001d027918 [Zea mays]ONL94282.1 hypothetical protein ZEAMMB73_Zm00001d027918 [Zea mays]|eukprot:XP_008651590.1 uncharacterized protein LOC103631799 [Zea mays]